MFSLRLHTRAADRWSRACAALLALVIAVPTAALVAAPAQAFAPVGEFLQITKSVDVENPAPGQTFTYSIQVTCSEEDCENASLADALPAELAGFPLQSVDVTPNAVEVPRTITWTTAAGSSPTRPAVIDATTSLDVDLRQPTAEGVGLEAGQTFTVILSLQVPADFPPGDSGPIVNTATTTADNSLAASASAPIRITSEIVVDGAVTKEWSPASQSFSAGQPSTITLGISNASNVAVDTLTIQEPKTAADGATVLDASNPFTIAEFTGFGATALPAGCLTAQVDAYILDGGTWSWLAGEPVTPPALALPTGVDQALVGGLRITCTGDVIAPGDGGTFALDLVQRGDLTRGTYVVNNIAVGTVSVAGEAPVARDAAARHEIVPIPLSVSTTKNIAPDRVAAGSTAAATIGAVNGDVPVSTLSIVDADYFTPGIVFGGWSAPIAYPAGATTGSVSYTLAVGGVETVPFATLTVPAAPSGAITGFSLDFTGTIAAGATVNAAFPIVTAQTATGTAPQLNTTNTVSATVASPGAGEASASDTAPLVVVAPGIATTLDKTIAPSGPLNPGDATFVSLQTRAMALTDTSTINDIVVEDAWDGGSGEFWNAVTFAGVAPTQIPAGASLTVQVRDGGVWRDLAVYPAQAGAVVVELTGSALSAALDTAGIAATDIEGVRFLFGHAEGFAQDTTVRPLVAFEARSTPRVGATPPLDQSTPYVNTATVTAAGISDGGAALADDADDQATVRVVIPAAAPGPIGIEKQWASDFVDAQSGQQRSTTLDWNVDSGYEQVVISDPTGAYAEPAGTVYEAFDLFSVGAIAASATTFSNGWYLRYDDIVAIELWSTAVGDWVPVPAPAAGWVQDGRFVGYTLTQEQRASTQGSRVVLREDTAAREAARQSGAAFDPFAPLPGSGVASSSSDRQFTLIWQVRDVARSDARFVAEEATFNTEDAGVVDNSVGIDATPIGGGTAVRDVDNDTIRIIDVSPAVRVGKTTAPAGELFVPRPGTDPGAFPVASWTVTGGNASTARASFVRLTDPRNCDAGSLDACQITNPLGDPFAADRDWLTASPENPFNRFTLENIDVSASIPGQVDLTQSVVWLQRFDESTGDVSTEQISAVAAAGLGATQLVDVIGVSVTFQGTNAGQPGVIGTITQSNNLILKLDGRLRPTLRADGVVQNLPAGRTVDVTNSTFAQSYDPVLSAGVGTGAQASSPLVITGGIINVAPTKTITPEQILRPNAGAPITVALGATQGTAPRSTLSPSAVTLDDQEGAVEFWNAVDFVGLGAIALPAGATSVRVDVFGSFDGAADTWVTGTAAAPGVVTVPVPLDSYPDIRGVRFVFTNGTAGALFSQTLPAPGWQASAAYTVQLRDNYRDTDAPLEFTGFVTNTQSAQATRDDGKNSAVRDAADTLALGEGTRALAVNKLTNGGNRTAIVGSAVPFRLTFQNTGTGFLTLDEVRDVLPAELVWTGEATPVYGTSVGGTLSTDVSVAVTDDGRTLTFGWPEGGRTMQPGETFTIDLPFELQPGLAAGASATNTIVAQTVEELSACTNTNAPAQGTTGDYAADPTTCGATDFVTPAAGANLFTVKGVRGSLEGATRGNGVACAPTLLVEGEQYFRTPCIANSAIGGTDDWVLRAVNAGTFTVSEAVVFDQLPTIGDRSVITGNGRGTQYRPELIADSLQVSAPTGTSTVLEVTTTPDACRGTWSNLQNQTACQQAGEIWNVVGPDTDWSAVTGIRASLDFRALAGGGLRAGQAVAVTFSTENVPASVDSPQGAPTVAPATETLAVNQFGVKYTDQGGVKKIAPGVVGVRLLTGSIEVGKEITGDAVAYAPTAFTADVSCTIGDVALDLGDNATVELTEANGYAVRLAGIPYGTAPSTECTVAESGATGSYGETERTVDPVGGVVAITEPDAAGATAAPAAQVVTLGNEYAFTGLSVTKAVVTEATEGDFGPFDFELSCTSILGSAVVFDADGTTTLDFALADGETFTAPIDTIPVGATCEVAEIDSSAADEIIFVGDNLTDNGDGTALVVPGTEPAEVTVTNGYDAGVLIVEKVIDGDGADPYGTGDFTFDVTCDYRGQLLVDETFELAADETRSFGVLPAGTICAVDETLAGGATESTLTPADGSVVVAAPTGEGEDISSVTVTATNIFDVGTLAIVKERTGAGAELYGIGPFTAQVDCTWVRDGETLPVALPNDGRVSLSSANGYRADLDGILVGAECGVKETESGGATTSTLSPSDGLVVIPTDNEGGEPSAVEVVITNVFDVTSLDVLKVVQGNLDADGARGDFEVSLACTWPVNGVDVAVDIPDGATRVLSSGRDYRAVYDELPIGSSCTITETDTGGASDSAITVAVDGVDRIDIDGTTAAVDLSTTTGAGQALVIVTNAFDAAVVVPVLPATGEQLRPALIAAGASLLAIGVVLMVLLRRRRSQA